MPPRADPKAKQSDVSRPAHLVTGQLRTTNQHIPEIEVTSEEYLAGIEEDWNKKIDVEIETLVNGMSDLVGIAAVGDMWVSLAFKRLTARARKDSRQE